jgi:hypothetical protein
MKDFNINYPKLSPLMIGFTRSESLFAKGIQLFRGIIGDKAAPNHAFIITSDRGQLFATEETLKGLEERSLERYTTKQDRIVCVMKWNGWTEEIIQKAQDYLAEVRRRAEEDSKYDFVGLFSFVPGFKKLVKPNPKKQWCSENCASILKKFGAKFIKNIHVSPDQLLKIMLDSSECEVVLNYYK